MSCAGTPNCDCGCCTGTSVQTPQPRSNLPGLSSLPYRVGTWASFKESMLARLSSSDYPALSALKTRDDDDFTVALLDATAMMLDVLTFYQERLANESYLGTAGQLRSLTELSRLIGYQPAPGVSASTYVAFSLRTAPGQPPDPSAPAITIPQGTQVQSVPPQGQKPQIFETSAGIQAKADWSALPVQTGQPWAPGTAGSIYLSGSSTQLQPGDSLLILGVDREEWSPSPNNSPSPQWDVVVLNHVQVDTIRKLTYVSWDKTLTHADDVPSSLTPNATAKVFAFRQKATLFGHNAPNPNLFVSQPPTNPAKTSLPALITVPTSGSGPWTWNNFNIPSPSQIDLDATYPKVVVGSWFALTSFSVTGGVVQRNAQLYKVQSAQAVSVSNFTLSSKVTELTPDYQDSSTVSNFTLPLTEVWAQSDLLEVAEQPLKYPLYGTMLDLQDLRPDLVGFQVVALFGKRQKIVVTSGTTRLSFIPDDGTDNMSLKPGDVLTLADPTPLPLLTNGSIPDWSSPASAQTLIVEDANERTGKVQAAASGGQVMPVLLSNFTLVPSDQNDPDVSEYALVSSVSSVPGPYPHTQIQLQSTLANCYDRSATTVNANVGLATHGQSVSEVMGSGSASTPNQSFTLKQAPLTFVQAPTPTGRQSTLQVQANGVTWAEAASLYGEGPSQSVFATLNQPDGTADVLFGDGVEGALLPTGQNNIHANYRIGLGSSGNVAANSLTTLIDRPLGVSGVTNPEAANGGQDAQSVDDIRSTAPLTVLTLGRAVSLADYESYASTFAGIAKAYALWIPSGPGQGVFLTVAGSDGSPLPPANPTLTNLVTSLQNFGNPLIRITAQSFLETLFGLSADLKYDPAYDQPTVQAQVLQALSQSYGFEKRTFGQGVSVDEVAAVIQAVPGVVAVNVKEIHIVATSAAGDLASEAGGFSLSKLNNWMAQQVTLDRPHSDSPTRIYPYLPVANPKSLPQPAEILVLDPDPSSVVLGDMS